ncbi:MAG: DUF222 domain-containing protein [Pseudonocardiaceae bacterium]
MFDGLLDLLEVSPAALEDVPVEQVPVEQVLAEYARIVDALDAGAPVGALPPPWESEPAPVPWSAGVPSGWLALELEQGAAVPAALSDADLIEGIVAFDRVVSWAGARQAGLLAEFARRRPENYSQPTRSDVPVACSNYASDEVGLALRLSRSAALDRLMMAQTLVQDLPATLAAWEAGTLDVLKVRAITETSYLLTPEQRGALEARVLPRATTQTRSQLRAALTRAVLAIDPDGAAARHQQRRKDRRVVVSPEETGMATLWALLSAPDASAAYQRLCHLARGLGADDPRGMDARRVDLLVDLLTGRRCAATDDCADPDCDCANGDSVDDGCCETPSEGTCSSTTDTSTGDTEHQTDTAEPPHTEPGAPSASPADPADRGGTSRGGHRCGAGRGTAGPGKPLISVIVPITMLLGLDEHPGELVGHGPIPAALAREIAAEGTWRRLLTDPASGTLLDYGRTTYTSPTGLADFVRARDVYCRNPICGQRAATADLDHTIPWPEGDTSEHNLYAGCRHDHLIKTHAPEINAPQSEVEAEYNPDLDPPPF